jgi:hypothetical protein
VADFIGLALDIPDYERHLGSEVGGLGPLEPGELARRMDSSRFYA